MKKHLTAHLFPLLGVFGLSLAFTAVVQASSEDRETGIAERIKPVGSVCIEGDAACVGGAKLAGSGTKAGDEVYKTACVVCHGAGVAGAPKLGDVAAWAARIAKGVDALYTSSINGFQTMPPKGTCMTCSDDEIKAAVDYMIENSR